MLQQEIETPPSEPQTKPEPESHPPQFTKAASLTGTLVQRGRDRAPRLPKPPPVEPEPAFAPAPEPMAPVPAPTPVADEVPLVFARKPAAPASDSRYSGALFFALCCVAFLATFLFVLRF